MRTEAQAQLGFILVGLFVIPLGIVMHYAAPHLSFGGLTAILGGYAFVAGVVGVVSGLWKSIVRPVEYSTLPADVADRLRALGDDPGNYQEMLRRDGAGSVRRLTESLERAASLFRDWSPKLLRFAEACRVAKPCPRISALPARDQAKIQIYETMIKDAERLPRRRKHEVVICCMPAMAIPVAQQRWPGEDDRCVFVTPEELSEWNTIYKHSEEDFWWFTHYWWIVDDHPKCDTLDRELGEMIRSRISDGHDPWLVTSGVQWGLLAGGEVAELWLWDGAVAKSAGVSCDTTY